MQYRIISVSAVFSPKKALENFVEEVNKAIAQGWEPQGGIAVQGASYLQAMVKRR